MRSAERARRRVRLIGSIAPPLRGGASSSFIDGGRRVASAPGSQQQATARIRFDSWSEFARFMNQDGGSRGLFVRAAVPPPIGTDLTVHFVLPDGSDLALPGRVAHRLSAEEAQAMGEDPGMGVQFTHMSEEQALRIQEIMANAESRQSM